MWKIIAALLYTFVTISNALVSNSSLIENKALEVAEVYPEYLCKEELRYVVSLGVFRDRRYNHICLAVMITGLNGITARQCGLYEYYAHRSSLIEREKDLAEKDRSKLHVNTKRPVHDDPDRYYTVTRFIDFDKHLFDQSKGENYYERPDIGVFVLKKEVEYVRQYNTIQYNVPISTINALPWFTTFTLIGMNNLNDIPPAEEMLVKKKLRKLDPNSDEDIISPVKPSQIRVKCIYPFPATCLMLRDLGGPVYLGDQFVGILVDRWNATIAIEAALQEHIHKIVASTWIPWINKRQRIGKFKASSSNA